MCAPSSTSTGQSVSVWYDIARAPLRCWAAPALRTKIRNSPRSRKNADRVALLLIFVSVVRGTKETHTSARSFIHVDRAIS